MAEENKPNKLRKATIVALTAVAAPMFAATPALADDTPPVEGDSQEQTTDPIADAQAAVDEAAVIVDHSQEELDRLAAEQAAAEAAEAEAAAIAAAAEAELAAAQAAAEEAANTAGIQAAEEAAAEAEATAQEATTQREAAEDANAQAQAAAATAQVEREAAARALEEFADQMTTGFNQKTLNAERRAIKREARARAAEYRKAVQS